jgi:hypothetical protein
VEGALRASLITGTLGWVVAYLMGTGWWVAVGETCKWRTWSFAGGYTAMCMWIHGHISLIHGQVQMVTCMLMHSHFYLATWPVTHLVSDASEF